MPEHRVDVILAVTKNGGTSERAEIILQNVLVLAAGQLTTRPEDKSVQVRTVTLALTPDQINALVAARTRGTLTLSLRGLNDNELMKLPEPEVVAVEEEEDELKVKPAPTPPPPVAVAVTAPPPPPPTPKPRRHIYIFHGPSFVEPVPVWQHELAQPAVAPTSQPALATAAPGGLTEVSDGDGASPASDPSEAEAGDADEPPLQPARSLPEVAPPH